MKKFNRQTLLVGGAVACMLIALITLFKGSGGEPSPASASLAADSQGEHSATLSPVGEDGVEGTATSLALNPEFYQRVRQQLLAVTPEHQEPFVVRDRAAPTASTPNLASSPLPGDRSMPVLPIALQPTDQSVASASPPTSQSVASASPPTSQSVASASPPTSQSVASASPPTNSSTLRLRGQIRDRANSKIVVLFELGGVLLRASNEPNAEWRIIRVEPRQITIRNRGQTLVLEVPYAP
ncbi:MAG: hypothetical protein NZL85_03925 [Fimbriimonadales bacterium]|nr:hypothetical protein [Fimbriimonadales bacterium]